MAFQSCLVHQRAAKAQASLRMLCVDWPEPSLLPYIESVKIAAQTKKSLVLPTIRHAWCTSPIHSFGVDGDSDQNLEPRGIV